MPPRRMNPKPSDGKKQKQAALMDRLRRDPRVITNRNDIILIALLNAYEQNPEMVTRLLGFDLED